jgi:hypothetical protein
MRANSQQAISATFIQNSDQFSELNFFLLLTFFCGTPFHVNKSVRLRHWATIAIFYLLFLYLFMFNITAKVPSIFSPALG